MSFCHFLICYISHFICVLHERAWCPVLFAVDYYSCIAQHVTVILFGFMTINRIELICIVTTSMLNCDFSSNNNVWTKFYEFFGGHFEFRWVIFIMTD